MNKCLDFSEDVTIQNTQITKQAEAIMPTGWGKFRMIAFSNSPNDPMPHLAMVHESTDLSQPVRLRIHSECMTGDLFHSKRCDCGEQFDRAMEMCAETGGLVIYLRQEGRGIGLINKLKAYNLQDDGLNTVDANLHLGFEVDARDFNLAIQILDQLDIQKVHLLTNNPEKMEALEKSSIEVISRIPLKIPAKKENRGYLDTKRDVLGHLL
ncbi:MAG: GTP cyclohydrolase II [Bacteroidetes bacterium]|jgi:GTP cyclohydrolase II|nr:GTP cyclohydrolase II [Bacteroidota bacterium]MDF1863500.1 GTP cyclohydrolase II [Saprospiraceae bacterium]